MKKKDQMLAKIKRQQEITDGARAANRDLTDDETREFNNLQSEIDALRPQVEEEERQAAITAERNRVAEINAICRQVGMEPDNYIKDGSTVEAVRKAALDQMIQRGQPSGVHVTQDEGDKVRAAAVDGLLMRAGVTVENPTDGAREFQGMCRQLQKHLQADSGRHPCHDYCRQQQGGNQQGGSQRNRRTCRDPEKLPAVLYQRYQDQEQHRDRHLLPIRRHQCKRPLPHNKARQPLREKAHRQERDRLDRCKICDLRGRRRTWHRMTPASAWGAYPRSTIKQERPAWYSATKTAP